MGAIAVHLDACLRLCLTVGVATDVVTAVDDGHLTTGGRSPLGDREAEKARANDEKIHAVLPLCESVVARDETPESARRIRRRVYRCLPERFACTSTDSCTTSPPRLEAP